MPDQQSVAVDDNRLFRLTKIFRENGWFNTERSEILINNALDASFKLARRLDAAHFEMFCEMLKGYLFVEPEKYIPYFERAINKIKPHSDPKHIYKMVPLISPKDASKVKSGNAFLYTLARSTWGRSSTMSGYKVEPYLNLDEMRKSKQDDVSSYTVLAIDDFIGGGSTAEDFINHLRSSKDGTEQVIILALVGMKKGIDKILSLGCEIIVDHIAPRGIEDCPTFTDKQKYYNMMAEIELLIRISDDYKLGFDKSEALVTMIRTPNNTFPLFWASKGADKSDWPSLFPR